jgi:predicted dehydrogenase
VTPVGEFAAPPPRPRPIVVVGAGGIVNDAHLPAYRALGYSVAALVDPDVARAKETAARFGIPRVAASLAEAHAPSDAIFDVAVPPQALDSVFAVLPVGAAALVQKPFGLDLAAADRLLAVAREKRLTVAVNFQLRFAPNMVRLKELLAAGYFGDVFECEVRVQVRTPWERWPFLRGLSRMELPLHSIHYLDLLRSFFGEPRAVQCRTLPHPAAPGVASTRTTAILDYGDLLRVALSINHHHGAGPEKQASELRLEGVRGAALAVMGVNLDYPRGAPDRLELAPLGGPWREEALAGSWFPDAFRGPMTDLQRFVAGESDRLASPAEDARRTMALVEALALADRRGGVPLSAVEEGGGA